MLSRCVAFAGGGGSPLVLAVSLAVSLAATAHAHDVTVDGNVTDWSARLPPYNNLGIIVRDAAGSGEYVFDDAAGDVRTDAPVTPEQDITRLQVTANATTLYFLVRNAAVVPTGQVPQVQIAIDLDRVAGSGQTNLAGFADTSTVSDGAWEYLVQTRFGGGVGPRVYTSSFSEVLGSGATSAIVPGVIEVGVPWTAFGLSGPPTGAIRLTVASFISTDGDDNTADLGGPTISNAFDAIGDCGDPRQAGYLNAWDCDLNDQAIAFHPDVYFAAGGDVYAPLLITHYVANAAAAGGVEWIAIRNVTPGTYSLTNAKLGDEETPDSTEGMVVFPSGVLLAAGQTYVLGANGATYLSRYGELPDAELAGATAAADVTSFALWTTAPPTGVVLTNAGDQILLLDASNTILDVALYGTGTFFGVVGLVTVPTADQVLRRSPVTSDTDNCGADFATAGVACADAANCAPSSSTCNPCLVNTCTATTAGTACLDGDPCNGDETCNGAGSCVAGPPLGDRTINSSAGAGGSISPSGAVPVACNASQAFTITPAAGHAILDVFVDGSSVGAVSSYSFTNVVADRTIAATFRAIVGAVPDRLSLGTPFTIVKNGGNPDHLDLSWGDSCGAAQTDFALYEGTVGTWYSHTPRICSTGNASFISDLTPAAGLTYYLAVPRSATAEGSYGTDSTGAQIPQGAGSCLQIWDTATCP